MIETVANDNDIINGGVNTERFTELSLCARYTLKTLCALTHLISMKEGP